MRNFLTSAFLCMALASCGGSSSASGESNDSTSNAIQMTDTITAQTDTNSVKVEIETTLGAFTVLLYGDTPLHRDNFIKLVNDSTYNGTLFHRVIDGFMVQAGDPDSKTAQPGQQLGAGDVGYTIPAEFRFPAHFHKRGALAAARQGDQVNPERRSSGCQFYVVTGEKYTAQQMKQMESRMAQMQLQDHFNALVQQNRDKIQKMRAERDSAGLSALQNQLVEQTESWGRANRFSLPAEVVEAYTTVGGTPHLDGQYTVFGEVVSGMDVIDKIEKAETDRSDRPTTDIRILSAKIVK